MLAGLRPGAAGRRRDEQGASALELSFIAPALIFLIFFTIQGALYYYGRSVAIQAAREGVSQLRTAQDQAQYDARREVIITNTRRFALQLGREALIDPQVTPTYDDARGRVRVQVEGRVITLIPGLDLMARAEAEGSIERFEGVRP